MSRCIIITPLAPDSMERLVSIEKGDLVLCADGGYDAARRQGIKPDMVLGDFDSIRAPQVGDCPVTRVSRHKDETDTFLCLRAGMEKGCRSFIILGGLSGRLDHTMANLQLMAYGREKGLDVWILNENNMACMLGPGEHRIPRREGVKLSLFSYTEKCTGIHLSGVEYPLENAELTFTFPLGVSNEFKAGEAAIRFESGLLLLILSREK